MKNQLVSGGILALQIGLFIALVWAGVFILIQENVKYFPLKFGVSLLVSYFIVNFVGKKLRLILIPDSQPRKELNIWVGALLLLGFPCLWWFCMYLLTNSRFAI